MTIERVIQLAGLVERGNVLPEELAIEFLSEFDGMIQSDIMLHAPEEIVRYDGKDQELILRPPHDGLYLSFLVAMIRQCQDEYEGYNNAQEIVEDKLKTFRRWYIHHYRPADTGSRSYTGGTSGDGFGFAYVSAYGLAVKHGYQGTEEEWLQSLKGAKGDAGAAARMRYDAERDMVQWGVGDEWQDLYTMAQVLAPLYEKLDEMTARVETAAGAAEDAAGTAVEKANQAVAAAEGANQARAGAETAREETTKLRDETRILMQDAETAAQTSRGEAERAVAAAAAGGVKTGKDAPSTATEGRVGSLYLQTGVTPNCLWVCIGADDGVYRWQQCNAYAELDLRDDGDGGVLLVPEGTETEPVLNLYGRHADENVTLRGVAPAQRDTDAPNLRQVQELIGQGGSGGAGYVASDEPPENTKAMWVNTAEPEEAVALGVTAVETAEGVDLYCTDELGTTKVTVRNGKDFGENANGGISADARNLLVTILRNANYYTDQSANITALEAALAAGGGNSGEDNPDAVTYSITNNLTNVVNSNGATSVAQNAAYSATLTAAEGYVVNSVVVTMGSVDVTASAYNNGYITIAQVTGDVVITATATISTVQTEELTEIDGSWGWPEANEDGEWAYSSGGQTYTIFLPGTLFGGTLTVEYDPDEFPGFDISVRTSTADGKAAHISSGSPPNVTWCVPGDTAITTGTVSASPAVYDIPEGEKPMVILRRGGRTTAEISTNALFQQWIKDSGVKCTVIVGEEV